MSLPMPLFHSPSISRKHSLKHRTAFLALFSLLTFTCYLLFIAYPSIDLSRSLLTHVQDHDRSHAYEDQASKQRKVPHRKVPQQPRPVSAHRPTLTLTPTEELAALAAFIGSLPHNVLPPTVDPAAPLDPQLVLDFDPRSESARDELDRVVEQVWVRFPVILFAKGHSSDSRETRHILANMHLKPAPLIIEADQREDADVLLPLLTRLTHVPTLPVLLIGGQPVAADTLDKKGVMTEIRKLHENGELKRRILEAGAASVPGRRKGRGNKS